jgi:alanyl-tRNA synthetase
LSSEVVKIYVDGKPVDKLSVGEDGAVILSSTPFYAESGGQIGDTGTISAGDHSFTVVDTKMNGKVIVHLGSVQAGGINVGDKIDARVDAERRQAIRLNHSATHLMHAALRDVLGDHVQQKGSLVAANRLRFDFSHDEGVTTEQLHEIETIVNDEIRRNVAADTQLMSYDDAVASGAMALFGEKYDDEERVLNFGDFSIELCGGTHVDRTGDIGVFKITHEGGIASGVRRIEAVTGKGALEWLGGNQQVLENVAGLLKSQPEQVATKIDQLIKRNKDLEKELAAAKQALVTGVSGDRSDDVQEVGGIKVLVTRIDGADAKTLRDAVDRYKDKLQSAIVVLGSVDDGVVRLAAGVTKDNTDRIRAGDLIKPVAEQVGGKGGGRPDFAQAGGNNAEALDDALASVSAWVAEQLA